MKEKHPEGSKVYAPDYNEVVREAKVIDCLSALLFVEFLDDGGSAFVSRTDKRLKTR